MSEEQKWKKISDKKYQLNTEDGWIDIHVPFAKVELLFSEFMGNNGMIDPDTGYVKTDIATLIHSFGSVGDAVLTKFGPTGDVVEKGCCRSLGMSEIPALFSLSVSIIEDFTQAISGIQGRTIAQPEMAVEESSAKKTEKTPK